MVQVHLELAGRTPRAPCRWAAPAARPPPRSRRSRPVLVELGHRVDLRLVLAAPTAWLRRRLTRRPRCLAVHEVELELDGHHGPEPGSRKRPRPDRARGAGRRRKACDRARTSRPASARRGPERAPAQAGTGRGRHSVRVALVRNRAGGLHGAAEARRARTSTQAATDRSGARPRVQRPLPRLRRTSIPIRSGSAAGPRPAPRGGSRTRAACSNSRSAASAPRLFWDLATVRRRRASGIAAGQAPANRGELRISMQLAVWLIFDRFLHCDGDSPRGCGLIIPAVVRPPRSGLSRILNVTEQTSDRHSRGSPSSGRTLPLRRGEVHPRAVAEAGRGADAHPSLGDGSNLDDVLARRGRHPADRQPVERQSQPATPAPERRGHCIDPHRDATTLPMIPARGREAMPLLAICRGSRR